DRSARRLPSMLLGLHEQHAARLVTGDRGDPAQTLRRAWPRSLQWLGGAAPHPASRAPAIAIEPRGQHLLRLRNETLQRAAREPPRPDRHVSRPENIAPTHPPPLPAGAVLYRRWQPGKERP